MLQLRSLWSDEFWTLELARLPFLDGLKMVVKDTHPPLYYLYINLWVKLFGTSELALFSSNLPFLLIFWAVAVSWRNWFLVVSPCLLHGFYELRGYGMLTAWVMLALWAVNRKPRLYILAVILALYTEHLAWPWAMCLLCLNRRDTMKAMFLGLPMILLAAYQALHGEGVFQAGRMAEYYQPIWMVKKIVGFYWQSVNGYAVSMVDPGKMMGWFR